MYKVGICDDSEIVCQELQDILKKYAIQNNQSYSVESFHSGEEICEYYKNNTLDILVLKIEMHTMNGIEAGDVIRSQLRDYNLQIIYMSDQEGYARELFNIKPIDFLIKPIKERDFIEAIEKAQKELRSHNQTFQYRYRKTLNQIPCKIISCFISDGRRIQIVTEDGRTEFYGKLCELEERLPEYFLQIHQSYIINTNFAKRFTYDEVELMDGTILTISKKYKKNVRQKIMSLLR